MKKRTLIFKSLLIIALNGFVCSGGQGGALGLNSIWVAPESISFKADIVSGKASRNLQIIIKNFNSLTDNGCLDDFRAEDDSQEIKTTIIETKVCNGSGVYNIPISFSAAGNSKISFRYTVIRTFSKNPPRLSRLIRYHTVQASLHNEVFRLNKPILEIPQKECTKILSEGADGIPVYRVVQLPKGATLVSDSVCANNVSSGIGRIEVSDSANQKLIQNVQFISANLKISMDAYKWLNYPSGPKLPLHPTQISATSFRSNIPDIKVGSLNYLTQLSKGAIRRKYIRTKLNIVASPGTVFDYKTESFNVCNFPAHIRTYVQRGPFETTGDNDRWWSNPIAVELKNGQFEMINKVDPTQWSNVNGHRANQDAVTLAGFQKAFREVYEFGYTLGGGCFFGHGVRVKDGTATLQLDELSFLDDI